MKPFYAVGASSVAKRLLVGRAALVSFAYIGTPFCPEPAVVELRRVCSSLFLDSGAFTAWSKGSPIDLPAYIRHVEEHGARYDVVAALDAIGDWRASKDNLRTMMDAIKRPILPVFHEGEPIELLEEYAAIAPLIGLGRIGGRRSKEATLAFYDECFNRCPDHRFHAFGNGDPLTLEPYPFESFDCSSWERDAAYGNKHGWPWSRVPKEMRMTAYIEALATITHRPPKQLRLRMHKHAQTGGEPS